MRFTMSCELFWGFSMDIDDYYYDYDSITIAEVADIIKDDLLAFLRTKGLLVLVERANSLKLHSHEYPMTTTLRCLPQDTTIYICDCNT